MNQTAYNHWVMIQQEPELGVLIAGKMKREPTTLQEHWRSIKLTREAMGEEAFLQKEKEYQEWELNKYKEDHDL